MTYAADEMGPPMAAAKIIIRPGFVLKQRTKSPSFPLIPALAKAHKALIESLTALPKAPIK